MCWKSIEVFSSTRDSLSHLLQTSPTRLTAHRLGAAVHQPNPANAPSSAWGSHSPPQHWCSCRSHMAKNAFGVRGETAGKSGGARARLGGDGLPSSAHLQHLRVLPCSPALSPLGWDFWASLAWANDYASWGTAALFYLGIIVLGYNFCLAFIICVLITYFHLPYFWGRCESPVILFFLHITVNPHESLLNLSKNMKIVCSCLVDFIFPCCEAEN